MKSLKIRTLNIFVALVFTAGLGSGNTAHAQQLSTTTVATSNTAFRSTGGVYSNGARNLPHCYSLVLYETLLRANMEVQALYKNIDHLYQITLEAGFVGALSDTLYTAFGALSQRDKQIANYRQRIATLEHILDSFLEPAIDEGNLATKLASINAARRVLNMMPIAYNCQEYYEDLMTPGLAFTGTEDYIVEMEMISLSRDIIVTTTFAAGGIAAGAVAGTSAASASLAQRAIGAMILGCVESGGEALIEALDNYYSGIWTLEQLERFVMENCGLGASIGGLVAGSGEVSTVLQELQAGGVLE